jgi:hypothetical protein
MLNDGGTFFCDYYDSRRRGALNLGVNNDVDFGSSRHLAAGASYTVKVGDLCFVALGQIVNRHLLLFGSVTKDGVLWIRSTSLNSPVEMPALATAAQSDWLTLTTSEHEKLLEREAWENESFSTTSAHSLGAIQRLLFYYPARGVPVSEELLRRDLVDSDAAYAMLAVLQKAPVAERPRLALGYKVDHPIGDYSALVRVALRESQLPGNSPHVLDRRRRAEQVLRMLVPDQTSVSVDHITDVSFGDQSRLVNALDPFDWPTLPEAMYEVFDRACKTDTQSLSARLSRDQLMLQCAKRLKKSSRWHACALFLNAEIEDLKAKLAEAKRNPSFQVPESSAFPYRVFNYALDQWLAEASAVLAL